VDKEAKLFHLESRSRAQRKRILRQELAALQGAIEQLQQVSQQRQLRENERKLRFQQLQQQQLQQQLHQQQYAMAAQAQHQQYLMKLIDQQRQQQLPQPQAGLPAGVVPPQKRAPAKPKAVKIATSAVSYAFFGQRLHLPLPLYCLYFCSVGAE
jgi:TolA-binding protein